MRQLRIYGIQVRAEADPVQSVLQGCCVVPPAPLCAPSLPAFPSPSASLRCLPVASPSPQMGSKVSVTASDIDVSGKSYSEMPYERSAREFTKLKSVAYTRCRMSRFPKQLSVDLSTYPSLIDTLLDLDLSGNELEAIPDEICLLVSLKKLRLDGNHLNRLPVQFPGLYKLEKLYLNNNDLTELPVDMGNMAQLKVRMIIAFLSPNPSHRPLQCVHLYDGSSIYIMRSFPGARWTLEVESVEGCRAAHFSHARPDTVFSLLMCRQCYTGSRSSIANDLCAEIPLYCVYQLGSAAGLTVRNSLFACTTIACSGSRMKSVNCRWPS